MMKITLSEEVTRDLMNLEWRPVDYTALMTAKSWLSIWLRDKISTNYIHANFSQGSKYSLLLSTIMKGANMADYANLSQAHHKIMKAFEDLKDIVIVKAHKKYVSGQRGGRKLVNVRYHIIPTVTFADGMIEANKRMKKLRFQLEAHNERRKHTHIS